MPKQFLIDDATIDLFLPLIQRCAPFIRINNHIPSAAFFWWKASVPLSAKGKNRQVTIRGMTFDVELSQNEFVACVSDFGDCGLNLVQSEKPLPPDLDLSRFRSEASCLKVLNQCGARLWLQLPHPFETASLTLFNDMDVAKFDRLEVPYRSDAIVKNT